MLLLEMLRDRAPRALVALSLENPNRVRALWTLLSAIAVLGIGSLQVDTSTDSVLDTRSEDWSFYEKSTSLFGGDELLVVALRGDVPFSIEILRESSRLTRELERIDGVRRVDSLSTVPFIRADSIGDLVLDAPFEKAIPSDEQARFAIRRALDRDPLAPQSLYSQDGKVIAVNVLIDSPLNRSVESIVRDVVAQVRWPSYWVSGVPVFRTEINIRTAREVLSFAVATIVLIYAGFYCFFAGARCAFVPVLVGSLGALITLGTMGALRVPLSLSTMILPSIVLALGCAYSIHVVSCVEESGGPESFRRRAEDVAGPVALSGLTTAIGFLAIAFVPIEALREVGAIGAFGAIVVALLSLSFAPVLVSSRRQPRSRGPLRNLVDDALVPGLLRISVHPRRVVLVGLAALSCSLFMLPKLSLETDATRWFRPGTAVRDDFEAIRSVLSGISPVNVVISADHGRTVTEPEAIQALARLGNHLRESHGVGKVVSLADPLHSIHSVFAPSGRDIDSIDLVEQYLLLLSSKDQISDLVDDQRLHANVAIRVDDNGSERLLELAREAEGWWQENGPRGFEARATGVMYEFARAENRIAWGQIRGLAFATACVGILLYLIFESGTLACAALLANAVPLSVAFGAMAFLEIPLDAGTVLVANLALGIAVDDTIHIASGLSGEGSLAKTFQSVLMPLTATTFAVGGGFLVLGFSQFAFTRNLGLLTFAIMVLCFLSDVMLLPALLRCFRRYQLRTE